MRYAILSDIHSNLEALSSVLDAIATLGADRILALGDLVGYNANPNECIEIIKKRGIICIMGNHDSRASGLEEPNNFNPVAQKAIYWTRKQLTEENKLFLKELPNRLKVDGGFIMVHGWIDSIDNYIISEEDARYNFIAMHKQNLPPITFFGHTHVRTAYLEKNNSISVNLNNPLQITPGTHYLINPGGAGQPRDKDPRAAFLLYDSDEKKVTFYRASYDIETARRKILEAGLPEPLADRLKTGW